MRPPRHPEPPVLLSPHMLDPAVRQGDAVLPHHVAVLVPLPVFAVVLHAGKAQQQHRQCGLYLPGDCGDRGRHRNTRMDAIPRSGGGGGSHEVRNDVRGARHDEVRGGGRDQTKSLPRNQNPFHLRAAAGNMMWTLTLLLRISTVSKVPPPDYKF